MMAHQSSVSVVVARLVDKGLVSRTRLKDNARTVAINLTAKGKTLVEELIPIATHFEDVAVRSFSPKEIAELKTTLSNRRIGTNGSVSDWSPSSASASFTRWASRAAYTRCRSADCGRATTG